MMALSNIAVEEMLYDEQDLMNSMEKIEQINYHQQIEVNGIKVSLTKHSPCEESNLSISVLVLQCRARLGCGHVYD